jgi:hypothetical protein
MTPSQVRRLFLLLFAVGGSDGDGSDPMGSATRRAGGTCDDVHIVIRKHLSLAPFAMKRIVSRRVFSSSKIPKRICRELILAFDIVSFDKGIIGTVAYAVSRSSQHLEGQAIIDGESDVAGYLHGSATTVSSPMIKEITDMIDSAYSRCKPTGGSTWVSTLSSTSKRIIF